MGCGGCGHRRDISIQVNRNNLKPSQLPNTMQQQIKQPNQVSNNNKYVMTNTKICPICKSVMRSLHKYDKNIQRVIRNWYCTNPNCHNSKDNIQ